MKATAVATTIAQYGDSRIGGSKQQNDNCCMEGDDSWDDVEKNGVGIRCGCREEEGYQSRDEEQQQ